MKTKDNIGILADSMTAKDRIPARQLLSENNVSLLVIASIIFVVGVAAHFAIKLNEARTQAVLTDQLVDQAINEKRPACRIESVDGIKVEFCVRLVRKG